MCSKEINWYKKRPGASNVCWSGISVGDAEYVAKDLKTKDAMARFHVREEDGSLVSEAVAFSEIWLDIPSMAILGKFAQLPKIDLLAEVLYKVFLFFRARR